MGMWFWFSSCLSRSLLLWTFLPPLPVVKMYRFYFSAIMTQYFEKTRNLRTPAQCFCLISQLLVSEAETTFSRSALNANTDPSLTVNASLWIQQYSCRYPAESSHKSRFPSPSWQLLSVRRHDAVRCNYRRFHSLGLRALIGCWSWRRVNLKWVTADRWSHAWTGWLTPDTDLMTADTHAHTLCVLIMDVQFWRLPAEKLQNWNLLTFPCTTTCKGISSFPSEKSWVLRFDLQPHSLAARWCFQDFNRHFSLT